MFFPEQTVSTILQGHVNRFRKCFEIENWKACVFTFESMCFPITDIGKHVFEIRFCTGSGRTPVLKNYQNSYGLVSSPVGSYIYSTTKTLNPKGDEVTKDSHWIELNRSDVMV